MIRVRGRGDHAPKPQAGGVTDSDGGGRVRVGDEGWGWGEVLPGPTLLGAGEVKLIFWALRLKEKGEHSHNSLLHSNSDSERCRRIRGMKIAQ